MGSEMRHAKECVHCGLCTKSCAFLEKYRLDLEGFAGRPDLAYHCFLCGDCRAACPKDIDGRGIALEMRHSAVEANAGKVPEKGYSALIAEKKDYIFRGQRGARRRSVLFPGCNFPSFFPRTTEHIVGLLKEKADIGVLYDCCGKPISELGLAKEDERGLSALKGRLQALGVQEIIVLCPNCYHFLGPRLGIPVVSIYDKLRELGLGSAIRAGKVHLFVPCPDKAGHQLEETLLPFIGCEWENIEGIQCCGLGGCAAGKEPEISAAFAGELKSRGYSNVYTYCASCAGKLRRGGVEKVQHVLVDILGTGEQSELSAKSLWNRAKLKFK